MQAKGRTAVRLFVFRMAERKIIFAGDPPRRRISWLRVLLAMPFAAGLVAALIGIRAWSEGRDERAHARMNTRARIFKEHVQNARNLALLEDARRPRPDVPLTASQTAALLRAGAEPRETIETYRLSRPYVGPPEAALEAEIAGSYALLDDFYRLVPSLGLDREEIDRWVSAQAPTATARGEPDLRGAVNAHRGRAGLAPLR